MRAKTTLLLLVMFALAIGVGVVAGKLSARAHPAPAPEVRTGSISDELHLTPAQRPKMREIWERVQNTANDCNAQAKAIQYDYDQAVMRLLNKDQLAQYEKLTQESKQKVKVLEDQRRSAFKLAVDETRGMLDESQRKTYESLIKDRIGSLSNQAEGRNFE